MLSKPCRTFGNRFIILAKEENSDSPLFIFDVGVKELVSVGRDSTGFPPKMTMLLVGNDGISFVVSAQFDALPDTIS